MPTQRDVTRLSLSQLAWIARKNSDTVATVLRSSPVRPVHTDGRGEYYDPRDALPILFGVGEGLNPAAEKARADAAQADLRELDLAQKRELLVPREDSQRALVALAIAFVSRLEVWPDALATEVASESQPAKCQAILERAVRELREAVAESGEALEAIDTVIGSSGAEAGRKSGREGKKRPRASDGQRAASAEAGPAPVG